MHTDTRFSTFFGDWQGGETMAASPWAPASTATASIHYEPAVGGSLLLETYHQIRADGAAFDAHGVYMALPHSDQIAWYLFDSYGFAPTAATGRWQGDSLVLTKETERGAARHLFTVSPDELVHVIETAPADDRTAFSPFLTGRYGRVRSAT